MSNIHEELWSEFIPKFFSKINTEVYDELKLGLRFMLGFELRQQLYIEFREELPSEINSMMDE